MSALTSSIGSSNHAITAIQAAFSYLDTREIFTYTRANRKLAGAFNFIWGPAECRKTNFVGQKDFKEFLKVDIGQDPLFPDGLISDLLEPDGYRKYTFETHMVIHMSRSFIKQNGAKEGHTLNTYGKLIAPHFHGASEGEPDYSFKKQEGEDGYESFRGDARKEYGDKGIKEERYLLLIKMDQVLPKSRGKEFVAWSNEKGGFHATVEISEALDTVVACSMKFFKTKIYPSFSVCCKEVSGGYHLGVEGNALGGPWIGYPSEYDSGILTSRKFICS